MFKLDLKHFKKLSSDKEATHMVHSDGHILVLDHSTLHPKIKEKLISLQAEDMHKTQKMADGGMVEQPCSNPHCKSMGKVHPNCRCHQSHAKGGEITSKFCHGGQPHQKGCAMYAHGGQVANKKENYDDESELERMESDKDMVYPPADEKQHWEQAKKLADGGSVDDFDAMINSVAGKGDDSAARYAAEQASMPKEAMPVSMPAQAPAMQQAPIAQEMPQNSTTAPSQGLAPQGQAETAPEPFKQYSGMVDKGYQQGNQSADLQQQGEQQLGHEKAKALEDNNVRLQKAFNDFQEGTQHIGEELKNFIADKDAGHINPDKYWENHSKVAAGIGLILSGFNPAGKPNAASEFLDNQIDRSIKAQMATADNRKTLLGALQQQFNNKQDAANMAKLYLAADLGNKLDMAAAKATDPMAKSRALAAKEQLNAKYAPLERQMGMLQGLKMGDQSPQGMSDKIATLRMAGMPDLAKHYEERYVPGIGMAQTPIDSQVKERLIKQSTLINAVKNLRSWVKEHGASVDPRVRAEGETLATEVQQMYRQGVGASTSEGEQKLINNIIDSDPGLLVKRWNVDPKLKALQESMISSHNVTRKMSGLPLQEQDREFKVDPKTQYEKKIINGKAYMVPKKGR